MFEVRNATRSRDYPFTYIELFVDDNGKGEGSLVGLAKLSADKQNPNTFDIENFGTYAAKLMGVELRSR
jgi:glycosyltransferase involved in cell wall biosynthesis